MKASPGNRVLFLLENSTYPLDGRVRHEALALTAAGYRVSVICPAEPDQPHRETIDGVNLYRYPSPPGGDGLFGYIAEYGYSMAATAVLMLQLWLREGFDVIHSANPPDTFALLAVIFKPFGVRYVYDHHDLAPEMYYARFGGRGNKLVYRVLLALERFSCRIADHVIATNGSYRAIEMERHGVPADRITIVRNGPDPERMRPLEPDSELRARGKVLIGFAGVMGTQDGVDHLVRALRHLIFDLGRTDVFAVFIGGKGDAQASLRALASELGLDPYTWFTGWVSAADYVRYLSTVDICVDPDPSNPFTDRSTMIKMTEYMSVAKPIVAFDLTEHRVTAGDAALYVRPNDERAMAEAIAELIDDPARRQAMGRYGRQRIETVLAWRHSVPQLLLAYQSLHSDAGIELKVAS